MDELELMKKRGRRKGRTRRTRRKKPMKRKNRCWKGYRPVPGKTPFSSGSCKKAYQLKF